MALWSEFSGQHKQLPCYKQSLLPVAVDFTISQEE